MPAMSIVRKVALLGRPRAGPVIASICSMVYLPVASSSSARATPKSPMRLAMKLGVSFAMTTPLPS